MAYKSPISIPLTNALMGPPHLRYATVMRTTYMPAVSPATPAPTTTRSQSFITATLNYGKKVPGGLVNSVFPYLFKIDR